MKRYTSDPNCNGLCVSAYDLGVGEYGDLVAHAHPTCPAHGEDAE